MLITQPAPGDHLPDGIDSDSAARDEEVRLIEAKAGHPVLPTYQWHHISDGSSFHVEATPWPEMQGEDAFVIVYREPGLCSVENNYYPSREAAGLALTYLIVGSSS